MEYHNIFLPQSSDKINNNDGLSGKITYTSVIESIPENRLENPIINWENKNEIEIEWRWRFLKDKDRHVVEISKRNKGEERLFFNKHGQWVSQNIGKSCDKFVTKEYYVYTHK